jgi:hypothetical protein
MKNAPLTALLILLVAVASSGAQPQPGPPGAAAGSAENDDTSACVTRSSIGKVEAVDDYRVVLFSKDPQKAYLAQLAGGCFNLEDQSGLTPLDGDRNGQICGSGDDSIGYRRLRTLEKCRILGLTELTEQRVRELGLDMPPAKPKKNVGP